MEKTKQPPLCRLAHYTENFLQSAIIEKEKGKQADCPRWRIGSERTCSFFKRSFFRFLACGTGPVPPPAITTPACGLVLCCRRGDGRPAAPRAARRRCAAPEAGGCLPAGRAGGSAATAPALTERDPPEQVCRDGSPSPPCLRLHPWQQAAILGFAFQGYFWPGPPHADGSGPASPRRPCGRPGAGGGGGGGGAAAGRGEGAARTPRPPRLPRGAGLPPAGRRGLGEPAPGPAGGRP